MPIHRHRAIALLATLLVACSPAPRDTPASQPPRPAPADSPAAPAQSAAGQAPAPAPAAPQQPLEKIVLPVAAPSGGFAAHVIAQRHGFFRAEGLDADMPIMRTNLIAAALVAGEADYSGQAGPIVRNALAGMPFRLIAVTVDKSTRWIVSQPDIRTVAALKGKVVAVNAIGSSPHDSGILALEQVGLDPDADVTWLAAGPPNERFLTLQQGGAHATVIGGSELVRSDALGLHRLLRLEDVAPLPETALATTTAKLETNPQQVKRVLRAIVRALQFIKTDREGTVVFLMDYLELTRQEAEEVYDTTAFAYSDDGTIGERAMRFLIEGEKRALKYADDVPTNRVADFRPLYETLADLGITPAPTAAR